MLVKKLKIVEHPLINFFGFLFLLSVQSSAVPPVLVQVSILN